MLWTVVLEKTLESPLDCKIIQPLHPKGDQFWVFIGKADAVDEAPITLATWCKELTIRKDSDAGKDWRQGEGDDRGWDSWMASQTRWTWVWASPGSWWWIGKPGVVKSMGSQRVGHDWVSELTDSTLRVTNPRRVVDGMRKGWKAWYKPLSWIIYEENKIERKCGAASTWNMNMSFILPEQETNEYQR